MCVALPPFRTLLMGVLKRGLAPTDPWGGLFQDSDSLKVGGEAEGPCSGACTGGILGKLVEALRVGLDWG